jgi:uncharacterized membrane protein
MRTDVRRDRSAVASAVFGIFDPLPFGFFAAALIFDVTYLRTGEMLWDKSAAWLIAIGLVLAIVPRLINLSQVWITSRALATHGDRIDFGLNLAAIMIAIFNAFVHSRDAYGSMPAGVWLSLLTVILLTISHGAAAVRNTRQGIGHE